MPRCVAPLLVLAGAFVLALPAGAQQAAPMCLGPAESLQLITVPAAQDSALSFGAQESFIAGCDDTTDPFDVTIDWGDGSSSPARITPSASVPLAFDVSATHVYARAGAFDILIHIRDDRTGVVREDRHYQAEIVQTGVIVRRQALIAHVGSLFAGVVARVTRTPPDFDSTKGYTARIHWGDGSSSAGTITVSFGRIAVRGRHRWRRALRNATVSVTIVEQTTSAKLVVRRPLRVRVHRRTRLSSSRV